MVEQANHKPLKYGDHYLEVYGNPGVHQHMLRDTVRTKTYYNAIRHNRHLFKDKVVLDVGCGTGILSLFAANAGARKVIGVESSDIADSAKQIVLDNQKEHIITIFKGKLEDMEYLPDDIDRVDIIVSEFMGYNLFTESMAETVIYARDKWLKPNGLILPQKCYLFIVGVRDAERKAEIFDTWNNYTVPSTRDNENETDGVDDIVFDFSDLRKAVLRRPLVYQVQENQVTTEPYLLYTLNMKTVSRSDLRSLEMPFSLNLLTYGELHAFATFFTVIFTHTYKEEEFSTAPWERATHWRQSVFFFDKTIPIFPNKKINGIFKIEKNPRYERDIDTTISFTYDCERLGQKFEVTQRYNDHQF